MRHISSSYPILNSLFSLHYLTCGSSGGLQEELEAANSRHQAKVSELQHQLSSLNVRVERGNQALQQKEQVVNSSFLSSILSFQRNQCELNYNGKTSDCVFTQVEKTLTKLMLEVQESQDILNKYKTESTVRHQKVHTLKAVR